MDWSQKTADNYVGTLNWIDKSNNRVFDLRVPGVNQFMTAMAAGVAQAMAGEKTPQAAMDEVAAEWRRIVDRIGKDKVREAYANVVALEDNER
jgi:multiple sugar transport system substrate-binding protein